MDAEVDDRVRARQAPSAGPAKASTVPTTTSTPASTIEALMYVLRRGLSCLDDPANRDRLRGSDDVAMKEIVGRLRTWKSRNVDWLRPWMDNDIAKLIKVWRTLRGAKRDG